MLANSRGNAIIEIVPILAVFILVVNFALGFFGLIHTGILNSIGARNYAFETFRNRTNLQYLRDVDGGDGSFTYTSSELRFHGIKGERAPSSNEFYATRRPIKFSEISTFNGSGNSSEEKGLADRPKFRAIQEAKRASEVGIEEGTNNAWVRTVYGICLTAHCGGS
jgi:hypothetical protein